MTACKVGDALLLKKCLEDLDSETVNMELGSDRWTALHIAAQVITIVTMVTILIMFLLPFNNLYFFQSGKKQIITLLLNNGADPTKRNKLKQVKIIITYFLKADIKFITKFADLHKTGVPRYSLWLRPAHNKTENDEGHLLWRFYALFGAKNCKNPQITEGIIREKKIL